MIVEFGHGALILALMVALFSALLPLWKSISHVKRLFRLSFPLALLQTILITTAFAALIYAHATSDFTVVNVVLNSHTDKPLLYKISGTWGNHEGSMMLWIFILSLYGLFVSLTRPLDQDLSERALIVLSAVSAGFIAFILFTSNPFTRVYPPAQNGEDLNPLLQDIGLSIHPPMLYMGYVGFGIVFAFAVAALWRGDLTPQWARIVQPWILLAWSTLTLGIGLGSWWAYRELGWGGWWFWDPVENVSLLPWLTATALLHANLALEKRGLFSRWVLLLAILTFTMSLMGTFIVRSGLITSVHAFASDQTRGLFILGYVGAVIGISLLLYARKYNNFCSMPYRISSKEGAILINNIVLVSFAFTVLIAILYPVFLSLIGAPSISVGAAYFNTIFVPFAMILSVTAGISPLLPWHRIPLAMLQRSIAPLLATALITIAIVLLLDRHALLFTCVALALSAWMLAGTVMHAIRRFRAIPSTSSDSYVKKLRRFPIAAMGTLFAHLGVAVLFSAITISSAYKQRFEAPITQGKAIVFNDYTLSVTHAEKLHRYNYDVRTATFLITHSGEKIAELSPEMRYYPIRQMQTSEVAIDSNLWRDVYLVLGEATPTDESAPATHIGIRLYVTPGMFFLWLGFGLIALGGGISFIHRMAKAGKDKP